jgi:hypothetical protein
MDDETTILPAHEAVATLRREIAVLEQESAALEADYTRRLEALNQQPTKVRQMQLSFGLFILGTILFVTVNQFLALLAIAIAIGLAWDSRRHQQQLTAEKMAVYNEGEEIWEEKQALLTEKRAALDELIAASA